MLNSTKPQSRTAYRSFRYSLTRQGSVRTADPMSAPKFRIKKNSVMQSTMNRTGGFDTLEIIKPSQIVIDHNATNYLRNFHSAMQSQRKMLLMERKQWKVKPLRFKIDNFQQLDVSDFTLLDPFQRHLKAIQSTYKDTEEQLKKQSSQIKQIQGELQNLKRTVNISLIQIQRTSINQLQKFTALLKQNTIKQQQTKLKFKQDIALLEIQHQDNLKKCGEIVERNLALQDTIFNCQPFELQENVTWKELSNTETTIGVRDGTLC